MSDGDPGAGENATGLPPTTPITPLSTPVPTPATDGITGQWQERLMPWMVSLLIGSALLFGVATMVQYNSIYTWITGPHVMATDNMWTDGTVKPTNYREQMELADTRARFALEREVIGRRYANASQFVANRLWARFMGFMTGMILAIVGSAFVLGKLGDTGSQLSGGNGPLHLDLPTASPGIVLAVLGTVLIGMSLVIQSNVTTTDYPLYFTGAAAPPGIDPAINGYDIDQDPAAQDAPATPPSSAAPVGGNP